MIRFILQTEEINSFHWTGSRFREGPTRSRIQLLAKFRPRKVVDTRCGDSTKGRGPGGQETPHSRRRVPLAVYLNAALMRLPALKVIKEGENIVTYVQKKGVLCLPSSLRDRGRPCQRAFIFTRSFVSLFGRWVGSLESTHVR